MQWTSIEAVVIQATPFQDQDRMVTLFSAEEGLFSVFVAGAQNPKKGLTALTTPLIKGSFLVAPSRKEVWKFKEARLLEPYVAVRSQWQRYQAAVQMLQAARATQMAGSPAPQLYQLLVYLLDQLGSHESPELVSALFRMKCLLLEGEWNLSECCSQCGDSLQGARGQMVLGGLLCLQCAFSEGLWLSAMERNALNTLTQCKNSQRLLSVTHPKELALLVEKVFLLMTARHGK